MTTSHYRALAAVVWVCWYVSLELLYSLVVIACVHKKSPRASIKKKSPSQSPTSPSSSAEFPSFILFPVNWAFAPLHVSTWMHGYRAEGCISLCAIWWQPSGIQADSDLPLVVWGEDGSSSTRPLCMCAFITLQQVCTGRGIHLQYKLLIWLLIFDLQG